MGLVVAKVGGSLLNLPDLRERLERWASARSERVLFVPGGGEGADVIRRLDRLHGLGEDAAHWLALRVLSVNAHLLAKILSCVEKIAVVGVDLLPSPPLRGRGVGGEGVWASMGQERATGPFELDPPHPRPLPRSGGEGAEKCLRHFQSTAILDPFEFCVADEATEGALPHCWQVTSDSIAARVAEVMGAKLVLLKSTDRRAEWKWSDAASVGLVDETFGSVVERANLEVDWVNLRR